MDNFTILLTFFAMACFIGYFVVWGVTPALYSPLMSVSNAISGIVILGAITNGNECWQCSEEGKKINDYIFNRCILYNSIYSGNSFYGNT